MVSSQWLLVSGDSEDSEVYEVYDYSEFSELSEDKDSASRAKAQVCLVLFQRGAAYLHTAQQDKDSATDA